nr:glycosyltransferase [Marinobacterium sedimentorum]
MMFMGGDEEGGLEKHFVELANGLAERCELIAVGHGKYADRFSAQVRFHAIDLSRGRLDPRSLWRLVRLIRREVPDVVHAQASKAAQMLALLQRWLPGRKVATIHNLKTPRAFYGGFDRCICVSRNAGEHLGLSRYSVIYNGVRARPASLPPPVAGRPRVLAVGRLVEAKGFDTLINAWQAVNAELRIAGSGPLEASLRRQIADLGLEGRVQLLGHRSDVEDLLEQSQLTVISSRWEGFSYVFAESLLAGRAVIATDVPVANEVLHRSLIVPREDPEALAAMVNAALLDLEGFYRRYKPYFDFARANFTLERMVDHTYELYRELLNG